MNDLELLIAHVRGRIAAEFPQNVPWDIAGAYCIVKGDGYQCGVAIDYEVPGGFDTFRLDVSTDELNQ